MEDAVANDKFISWTSEEAHCPALEKATTSWTSEEAHCLALGKANSGKAEEKTDFTILSRENMRERNEPHFMNSCRNQLSVFSCAIDCFLELSHNIFFPVLHSINRSSFMDLLYLTCLSYDCCLKENSEEVVLERELAQIRERIWNQLVFYCPSFVARDSAAEFSEIFSSNIFQHLNTVLLRINAGGVHLIFDIFWGAFIQGRRLHEGGVY